MILPFKLYISLVMQKNQIGGSEKNLPIAQGSFGIVKIGGCLF
jgi:hypothetical protein